MQIVELFEKDDYKDIVKYIKDNPGTTQKNIIDGIERLSVRQLRYRLKKLVENDIVIEVPNLRNMKELLYYPNSWRDNK